MPRRSLQPDSIYKKRVTVILSRPASPENIWLVARGMKNTGFERLCLIRNEPLNDKSFVTQTKQPSYNLASAVLLTLFEVYRPIFSKGPGPLMSKNSDEP